MLRESGVKEGLGGLLMAVTMATVGRDGDMVEAAAFSTRGSVLVVRTGVTCRVF